MTKIHAQLLGSNVLLTRTDWDRLLGLARRSDEVEVRLEGGEVSTANLMRLAEEGGSFDFWHDDAENVYTLADGEPV